MTLQTDGRPAGRMWGYNNIPAFSLKSAGIIMFSVCTSSVKRGKIIYECVRLKAQS